MRWMDTATYLATQNDPAGPIINFVEDGTEPMIPATDDHGRVTKGGVIGYLAAYAVLAGFLGYLFSVV